MSTHIRTNQTGSALVIALIVAAVLIAGGVAAYFLTDGFGRNANNDETNTQANSTTTQTEQKQPEPQTATSAAEVKSMFADVVAGKYDVKCTFDDGTNSGIIYYSARSSTDIKMRFDTTSSDYNGHVLRLDDTVYTWAEGQTTGTKLTVTPSAGDQNYSVDKYETDPGSYNLTCENAGTLAASIFAVPADVTFMDIGQYAGEAAGAGAN